MEFGIYVHVPFCERICPYCDFNTYATNNIPEPEYIQALLTQLEFFNSDYRDFKLKSVYFGGGTPSLFASKNLETILTQINATWDISQAEKTIEVNPEHLADNYIRELKTLEFNRVSLGVQSLNSQRLKFLGRKHTPENVIEGIEILNKHGIKNYNMDLIFGLPEETLEVIDQEIAQYLKLTPQHISCYQLTIESGTAFSIRYPNKKVVEDDYSANCYERIIETLEDKGFHQYEISNFAKRHSESQHNLLYWNHLPYLGLGAGAHSFNKEKSSATRWQMIRNFKEYIKNPTVINGEEHLTGHSLAFDYIFSSLRKNSGFSQNDFKEFFDKNSIEVFPKLKTLETQGLVEIDENVKLTKRGLFLLDSIMEELSDES